jgi:hypothetical protein
MDPFSIDSTMVQEQPEAPTIQPNQLSQEQTDEAKAAAKRKLRSLKQDRLRQNDSDRAEQLHFLLRQARQEEGSQ